jgi:ferredoxin
MRVLVDDDCCMGYGTCCGICPSVFRLGPKGYAVTLVTEVPEQDRETVREAARQCPSGAISIEE